MISEFIFLAIAVLDLTFILLISRLGKAWLNFAIIVNILLISTFGAKLVSILGFTTNAGNVFYAAVFFATQLLIERYGKGEGYRSVWRGICAIVLFILMSQLIVQAPGAGQTAMVNQAIATLFQAAPRIALASLTAYGLSQLINIWVFDAVKRRLGGRWAWVRLNLSNAVGQLVDSLLFFTIAFYGVLPAEILVQALIGGFIIKVMVGALSTPFFYAGFLINPRRGTATAEDDRLESTFPSDVTGRYVQLIVVAATSVPLLTMAALNYDQLSTILMPALFVVVTNTILAYIIARAIAHLRTSHEVIRQSEARLLQDVTKRKKAEAALTQKLAELEKTKAAMLNMLEDLEQSKVKDEAILASIGDGMVTADEREKIIQMNQVAATMLGWNIRDALGQPLSTVIPLQNEQGEVLPPAERPATQALSHRTITTTDTEAQYVVRRDQTRFPVAMVVTPVILDDRAIGVIDVFRDITHEQQVSKAKTEFVSLASHQLRTPLAAIKWYTELLLAEGKDALAPPQRELGQQIMAGNQRMIELVSALLDVSRLELGTFAVEPEAVNVVLLIKSVMEDFAADIERKRLQVTQEYGTVPSMNLDPRLLRIIVQNLVANAVQYTPAGGTITVSAGVEGEQLRFTVADTGIGIPANQHSQVFSKLFRADNVRTVDTVGTGLGLYLVKSILDHVNGQISFVSQEKKGTTFTVFLPLSGMREKQSPKKLGA